MELVRLKGQAHATREQRRTRGAKPESINAVCRAAGRQYIYPSTCSRPYRRGLIGYAGESAVYFISSVFVPGWSFPTDWLELYTSTALLAAIYVQRLSARRQNTVKIPLSRGTYSSVGVTLFILVVPKTSSDSTRSASHRVVPDVR